MPTPTELGYGGDGGITQTVVDGGSLPYTGLELLLLILVAILLIAAGWTLRATSRRL